MTDTIIAIAIALGAREIIGAIIRHRLGKPKTDIEIRQLQLQSVGIELDELRDSLSTVKELSEQAKGYLETIAALERGKIADTNRLNFQDGIIEEKRREVDQLYQSVIDVRAREINCHQQLHSLENRVKELEAKNEEYARQSLQAAALIEEKEKNETIHDTSG